MKVDSDSKGSNNTGFGDEIDLKALFNTIGRFFSNLYYGVLSIIIFLRNKVFKNWMLLGGFVVVGGGLGFVKGYLSRPYYETTAVLNSQFFRGQFLVNTFDNLNNLAEEENYEGLSAKLGIPAEEAEKIKEFILEPVIPEEDVFEIQALIAELDEVKDRQLINRLEEQIDLDNQRSYRIRAYLWDISVIPYLDSAVFRYIRQNEFVNKRVEINNRTMKARLSRIQRQLNEMDSLKTLIENNVASMAERNRNPGNNNVILASPNQNNPLEVYGADMRLYDQQLEVERALYLQADIELVEGFPYYERRANRGNIMWSIYGIVGGFGMGFMLLLLLDFNRYLNQVETRNPEEEQKEAA